MRTLLLLLSIIFGQQTYALELEQVKALGLPVLIISTVNTEMPDCEYVSSPLASMGAYSIKNATKVPGRLYIILGNDTLYDSGEFDEGKSGMTIKIRGNTSAYKPKKSYKIKLQKKADLLCREGKNYHDKNWVLLKDEQIKTKIGFKLNELIGLQWTPEYEYVNVVFNNEYWGMYMLVEQVRRNPECRLNVAENGYVFEYDGYWWNEDIYVKSSLAENNHYTFKYPEPEDISEEQLAYFTEMINTFENSITWGGYNYYIDVESFASWMLAQDILGNPDHVGSGYFLTKYDNTPDSKIKMANMWDFDDIFHESRRNQWSRLHTYGFYDALFKSPNSDFVKLYVSKWNYEGLRIIEEITNWLKDFSLSDDAYALTGSIAMDNGRWKVDNKDVKTCVDIAILRIGKIGFLTRLQSLT